MQVPLLSLRQGHAWLMWRTAMRPVWSKRGEERKSAERRVQREKKGGGGRSITGLKAALHLSISLLYTSDDNVFLISEGLIGKKILKIFFETFLKIPLLSRKALSMQNNYILSGTVFATSLKAHWPYGCSSQFLNPQQARSVPRTLMAPVNTLNALISVNYEDVC